MKNKITLLLGLVMLCSFIFYWELSYSETIYVKEVKEGDVVTQEAEVIKGSITELTEDTVWVEVQTGDITEYVGIDLLSVEKILNEDGTIYEYPGKKPEANNKGN